MITELHQQIENGEYFERARNWYADKYLSPNTHVAALLVMFLIAITGSYFVVDSMLDKYFADKYPIPIYVDDQVNFESRIKPLSEGYESIDISVARYLLKQYVIYREEYKYNGANQDIIQEKLNALKSSSSRRVFSDYLNYMSPQKNPNSPILKYKLQTERLVSVLSVNFPEKISRPSIAHVIFKATERNAAEETSSYWLAELNFSLNNIMNVLDYKSNLNFIVTSYQVTLQPSYKR